MPDADADIALRAIMLHADAPLMLMLMPCASVDKDAPRYTALMRASHARHAMRHADAPCH
jgi:hypothetical protein